MPEKPNYDKRPHPIGRAARPASALRRASGQANGYAELRCKSNFSFLRGASHPEELVEQAAALGYSAIALTDLNSLAGVVRMHCAAKEFGLKLIVGAEITPVDAPPILLYAMDRAGYGRLSRLITQGRLRAVKGECTLTFEDIAENAEGLIGAVVADAPANCRLPIANGQWRRRESYPDVFGDCLYVAASVHGGPDDDQQLTDFAALSRRLRIPMLATNDVHYHVPERRFLQDVLTCVREGCTIADAGERLFANSERHLKPIEDMRRLFADYPKALANTVELSDRCHFSLDELCYEYPEALCPPGRDPQEYLAKLTWEGARERYPHGVPDKVRRLIGHELALIAQLSYEAYFLTVWDIVRFARSKDILCQGRGSAANSAVCYCLGITSVDPDRVEMLFERFVSAERNEPPDIDVDFEHERREEVFQYIYNKYGRDHAGIVAEVITYRPRSAIRDVGKALGLSLDSVDALAKKHGWWDRQALPNEFVREAGLNPAERTIQQLAVLVRELLGFPRHLSQHVGGFVITRGPLCELVPIENAAMPHRTFVEWDKDDLDALRILKIDCLALGMLTAIHTCFMLLDHRGIEGSRDQGIKDGQKTKEREDGKQSDFSGFDRMAEGSCFVQARLSSVGKLAGEGAVRTHGPNAASSGLCGIEYRGGECETLASGLCAPSSGSSRVARGTRDSGDHRIGSESPPEHERSHSEHPGDPSCLTGVDRQPAPQVEERHSAAVKAVASIPRSLDPSIPSSLTDIPPEDPLVYAMICRADTVGVFQIESRAQMSMLPRLRPQSYYDLVIEVAIVRPGPIQGGMVHPYLRRRNGEEAVTYPSEAIREVLQRTLGVPLFQEQAMRLAIVAAGFTPGEADQLRRAMGAWRRDGQIEHFRTKLLTGMQANGLSPEFAERCFQQIAGFGEYGFPESHAASFALLVYVSAWLKRYHPAAFCAALINSQPMGFYQPAQLVRDAIEHGVTVLPIDVNYSGYDCRLSIVDCRLDSDGGIANRQTTIDNSSTWGLHGPAVRLGMRLIKGISEEQVTGIERAQGERPFTSLVDLFCRSGASRATLARLSAADAFRSLGLNRRQAVWDVLALSDEPPLLRQLEPQEPLTPLPTASMRDVVLTDYETIGMSLSAHPMSLIREDLDRIKVSVNKELKRAKVGRRMRVAGIVLVRQRPSTAQGIVFCTIEDETGTANLIIRPDIYSKYRPIAGGAAAIIASGRVERQGEVVHLLVERLDDAAGGLRELASQSRDFH